MRLIYILVCMPYLLSSIGFSTPMLGFASHAYLPVRALAHSSLSHLVNASSCVLPLFSKPG
eukprot:9513031-Ditylum_brightwellii.AAC.1